uniref:Secreted peptide n=1 Tax=Anopheles braziliensis TaxID=58242 RepID=A0A2M3ZAE9_9DIPT
MVCVPCFIIPVLLYIWHKLVQPILLKYWNPWEKKTENGDKVESSNETTYQLECKDGVCRFARKSSSLEDSTKHSQSNENAAGVDKKTM